MRMAVSMSALKHPVIMIVMLGLAACTPSPSVTTAPATLTPAPTVPLAIPAGVSTATAQSQVSLQCLEILPARPDDLASHGVLFLDSQRLLPDGSASRDTLILDMATAEERLFTAPNEGLFFFALAPDRRSLAYRQVIYASTGTEVLEANLVISGPDGKARFTIPWGNDWGPATAWLNNEEVLIDLILPEDRSLAERTSTFTTLNPQTGAQRTLEPDFPNIYDFSDTPSSTKTTYDPALSRVVYLAQAEDGSDTPTRLILWDLVKSKPLAAFETLGAHKVRPRWSPDGSQVALALSVKDYADWPAYEIQLVGSDGTLEKQTRLTDFYDWVYVDDLSWSPDGRYIAFWFSGWESDRPSPIGPDPRYLGIYDTGTGEVKNLCVPGDGSASIGGRIVPPPLWSPDGKQLLVQDQYSDDHSRVILVDPAAGIAAQIAQDAEPVGWLVAP
jgi:WD40 repeat protein